MAILRVSFDLWAEASAEITRVMRAAGARAWVAGTEDSDARWLELKVTHPDFGDDEPVNLFVSQTRDEAGVITVHGRFERVPPPPPYDPADPLNVRIHELLGDS